MPRSTLKVGMLGLVLAASSVGAQSTKPAPAMAKPAPAIAKPAPAMAKPAPAMAAPQVAASYKKELPKKLVAKAKITESAAAATALTRVPNGVIKTVELEQENGKLLYSYDISTPGKSGIEEVHVDAMTGTVLKAEHETPAMVQYAKPVSS